MHNVVIQHQLVLLQNHLRVEESSLLIIFSIFLPKTFDYNPHYMFRVITVHCYRIFVAVEMLRFYSWLKQILRKMDNNLNWAEIESVMGEWIRQKISGIISISSFRDIHI